MTIPATRWRPLLDRLDDEFTTDGVLTDPAWRAAFTTVPRHRFIPGFFTDDDPPGWVTSEDPTWLETVYSDATLATQLSPLPDDADNLWVTSSSTRPGYMLWMLHLLDVHDAMTVLEIGTGTGYTTALLSQRLGDSRVTSIDIDPGIVSAARRHLAEAGYHPALAVRDGATGHPDRAPFDRIIATVAVEELPPAWVRQTRPGGIILADLRPPGMIRAGALAKLTVTGEDTATGDLIDGGVGFMSARTDLAHPGTPEVPPIDKRTVHHRRSSLTAEALNQPAVAFTAWQRLPGLAAFPRPDRLMLTTPDGSWAEITRTSPAHVEHAGAIDLWAVVEDTAHQWHKQGRPPLGAHTITVGPAGTHIGTAVDS